MKRAILILFVLGFVSLNGYCQMVYKAADNKVYLDCTAKSKMPAGAVTTTPKCVEGTAYSSAYRNGSTSNNIYASENDKVFQLLEIDNVDYTNSATMNWITGYNGCKSKGTGWRLPTQRELMLMYIFREQLDVLTGTGFGMTPYWSSSEGNSTGCWCVVFNVGHVYNKTKTSTDTRVRCVREVMP